MKKFLVQSRSKTMPDAAPFLGNDAARQHVEHRLAQKTFTGTWLFLGPAHVGKRTLVQDVLRRLVCLSGDQDEGAQACGTCDSCRQWRGQEHPDVLFIQPSADEQTLGIETIRPSIGSDRDESHTVSHRLGLRPTVAPGQVVVIDGADTLTMSAGNALLKTLEEPPARATIILLAESAEKILLTVRSRASTVRFQRVPVQDIAQWLKDHHAVTPSRALWLARQSQGAPGTAQTFAAAPLDSTALAVWLESLSALPKDSLALATPAVAALIAGSATELNTLGLLLSDLIALKMNLAEYLNFSTERVRLTNLAQQLSWAGLRNLLAARVTLQRRLARHVQPLTALTATSLSYEFSPTLA